MTPTSTEELTPTQLRNARKRRAKERKRSAEQISSEGKKAETGAARKSNDPSAQYLGNPREAPTVKKAQHYFGALRKQKRYSGSFETHVENVEGWRTVSKLPVRALLPKGDDDDNRTNLVANRDCSGRRVAIGLFQPNSHSVLSLSSCAAHHSSIDETVAAVAAACQRANVTPYDETTGEGFLRYIAMNVERRTGKVQLTLIWNGKVGVAGQGSRVLNRLVKKLLLVGGASESEAFKRRRRGCNSFRVAEEATAAPPRAPLLTFPLHSLWIHYNAAWKHSNAIFEYGADSSSCQWQHVYGPSTVIETLDMDPEKDTDTPPPPHVVRLHFRPNVFRQANLDAFANIVRRIRGRIAQYNAFRKQGGKPSCLELYGGVGTIGLYVADLVSSLRCSDENPHNVECFQRSVADSFPASVQAGVSYVSKNASDMVTVVRALEDACEIVIVDPPRKGLDETVVEHITAPMKRVTGAQLLIYVSCGFDAFRRDCNALLESQQWTLDHAEGHVLFPGSDAIETLAFFERRTQ